MSTPMTCPDGAGHLGGDQQVGAGAAAEVEDDLARLDAAERPVVGDAGEALDGRVRDARRARARGSRAPAPSARPVGKMNSCSLVGGDLGVGLADLLAQDVDVDGRLSVVMKSPTVPSRDELDRRARAPRRAQRTMFADRELAHVDSSPGQQQCCGRSRRLDEQDRDYEQPDSGELEAMSAPRRRGQHVSAVARPEVIERTVPGEASDHARSARARRSAPPTRARPGTRVDRLRRGSSHVRVRQRR